MTEKERILGVITYYRTQRNKQKGLLKKAIEKKCDFHGGTFNRVLNNAELSQANLEAIEKIIEKHKKGEEILC